MKFWLHALAAFVGLVIAALIVYLVFGNASEQGATQDGSAGTLASAESLCGTIHPTELLSESTRALASKNPPAMSDAMGPVAAISDDKPDQKRWFARVHAASGLCIDEIQITPEKTLISMSTVASVSAQDAAIFTAAAMAQAFTAPFHPRQVTIVTLVGDSERTVTVSNRAWRAYQLRRKQLGLEHSLKNLKLFRQAVGHQFGAGLRITGW